MRKFNRFDTGVNYLQRVPENMKHADFFTSYMRPYH